MIVIAVVIWIGLAVFFKRRGDTIEFKHILIENTIIFTFIGIAEFIFFTTVAYKYVPASPAFMMASAIDSVKNQLIDNQNAL